jgi:hypothetical protein
MKDRIVFWFPRIFSIVFITFLFLFSLDVFGEEYSLWETILAFIIHNVPSIILIAVLIVSWKREIVGGIAFILAGFLYLGFIIFNILKTGFEWYYLFWAVQISGIAFLIGIFFFVGWRKRKKHSVNLK